MSQWIRNPLLGSFPSLGGSSIFSPLSSQVVWKGCLEMCLGFILSYTCFAANLHSSGWCFRIKYLHWGAWCCIPALEPLRASNHFRTSSELVSTPTLSVLLDFPCTSGILSFISLKTLCLCHLLPLLPRGLGHLHLSLCYAPCTCQELSIFKVSLVVMNRPKSSQRLLLLQAGSLKTLPCWQVQRPTGLSGFSIFWLIINVRLCLRSCASRTG